MELLKGKKTYIIGTCLILWALGGAIAGKHDWNLAIGESLIALQMMGVRVGLKK